MAGELRKLDAAARLQQQPGTQPGAQSNAAQTNQTVSPFQARALGNGASFNTDFSQMADAEPVHAPAEAAAPTSAKDAQLSMVRALQTQYLEIEDTFNDTNAEQGVFGRLVDGVKNSYGGKNGSNATREKVHALGAQLSALHDAVNSGTLSGEAWNHRLEEIAKTAGYDNAEQLADGLGQSAQLTQIANFEASQETGKNLVISGTTIVAAAAVAVGTLGTGAPVSAAMLASGAAVGAGTGLVLRPVLKEVEDHSLQVGNVNKYDFWSLKDGGKDALIGGIEGGLTGAWGGIAGAVSKKTGSELVGRVVANAALGGGATLGNMGVEDAFSDEYNPSLGDYTGNTLKGVAAGVVFGEAFHWAGKGIGAGIGRIKGTGTTPPPAADAPAAAAGGGTLSRGAQLRGWLADHNPIQGVRRRLPSRTPAQPLALVDAPEALGARISRLKDGKSFTVGQSAGADIRVEAPNMGDHVLTIQREGDRVWVPLFDQQRPVLSDAGTPVRQAFSAGSQVQISGTDLSFTVPKLRSSLRERFHLPQRPENGWRAAVQDRLPSREGVMKRLRRTPAEGEPTAADTAQPNFLRRQWNRFTRRNSAEQTPTSAVTREEAEAALQRLQGNLGQALDPANTDVLATEIPGILDDIALVERHGLPGRWSKSAENGVKAARQQVRDVAEALRTERAQLVASGQRDEATLGRLVDIDNVLQQIQTHPLAQPNRLERLNARGRARQQEADAILAGVDAQTGPFRRLLSRFKRQTSAETPPSQES